MFAHGGDILTAESIYGDKVIDFSANFNPLGMPEKVKKAAAKAASEAERYPDPFCRELRSAIAQRDNVKQKYVLCGNGAADLIFRLVFASVPKKAMVLAPTFAEYGEALTAVGCAVTEYLLSEENGFTLTESILSHITEDLDILFICNPNNPTGAVTSKSLLEKILEKCTETGTIMVVDECFIDLTTGAEGLDNLIDKYENLFLLRAFTKSYCMAGLRLGYCITSSEELFCKMQKCAQPWSVSYPAQMAGIEAAKLIDYPQRAKKVIERQRVWLSENLSSLGLCVYPSKANYILFKAFGVSDLRKRMVEQGILIRACSNYTGLTHEHYRIAVRDRQDNEKLINALREVLHNGKGDNGSGYGIECGKEPSSSRAVPCI